MKTILKCQLGIAESVWWPSPPALQLSQPVLSSLNMLRPHSLSRFHGSDVEVGVLDGARVWSVKGERREDVCIMSSVTENCRMHCQ